MIAAGIYTVGPNVVDDYMLAVIPLPPGLGNNPIVIATAQQQAGTKVGAYEDTFAVTVLATSALQFDVNIFRVDNIEAGGAGWGQQLQIAWIAMDPT